MAVSVRVRSWIGSRNFFNYAVRGIEYCLNRSHSKTEEEALSDCADEISWMISESGQTEDVFQSLREHESSAETRMAPISPDMGFVHKDKISNASNVSTCLGVFIESLDHKVSTTFDKKESITSALKRLNETYEPLIVVEKTDTLVQTMITELELFTSKKGTDESSQGLDR